MVWEEERIRGFLRFFSMSLHIQSLIVILNEVKDLQRG